MSVKSPSIPDYDLEEMVVVTASDQLRALADPLRATLLELVLERAATVTEMAKAVDRPKSTVAYHVNLLVDAGLLRVVRTRRVRAIEERFYGRAARTFYVGVLSRPEDKQVAAAINGLAQAAAESGPAHVADELRCTLSHARIPIEDVRAFWSEVRPDPPGRRPGLRLRRRSLSDRCAHASRRRARGDRLRRQPRCSG
jgi:DNA-binding transcriptional ArsR family regulator